MRSCSYLYAIKPCLQSRAFFLAGKTEMQGRRSTLWTGSRGYFLGVSQPSGASCISQQCSSIFLAPLSRTFTSASKNEKRIALIPSDGVGKEVHLHYPLYLCCCVFPFLRPMMFIDWTIALLGCSRGQKSAWSGSRITSLQGILRHPRCGMGDLHQSWQFPTSGHHFCS